MSSRLQEKQRLRTQREQRDRERASSQRRSRRIKLLGAVAAAAVAIVVVAIVASGGGGSGSNSSKTINGAAEVNARFDGIPQSGIVLGNPNAPVTFVEFADLKCPICREYTLGPFPELVNRYVRTGKVKMVFEIQHFVGNRDGDSERAARMALAAGQQNRMWQFSDLFYKNQRDENDTYVNDVFLRRIGSNVRGLDVDKAFAARGSAQVTQALQQAAQQFNTAGFQGTPSFAVGKSGGTLTPITYNSFDVSEFSEPIDKLLSSNGS